MDPKLLSAKKAVEFVRGHKVIGLGSGTTVAKFIALVAKEKLNSVFVPTSWQSRLLALEKGLKVVELDEVESIDVAVDGADEISPYGFLKGGGGCLAREKVVDYFAEELVIIADSSKLVNFLGQKKPVVLEILPFSWKTVIKELKKYGKAKLREAKAKMGPVITDNGNFLVDLRTKVTNAEKMEKELNSIPGVVENGIFTRKAVVIVDGELHNL